MVEDDEDADDIRDNGVAEAMADAAPDAKGGGMMRTRMRTRLWTTADPRSRPSWAGTAVAGPLRRVPSSY